MNKLPLSLKIGIALVLIIALIFSSFSIFIIFEDSAMFTVLNNKKEEYEEAQESTRKNRYIYDFTQPVEEVPTGEQMVSMGMNYDEAAVMQAIAQIIGGYTPEAIAKYLDIDQMFRAYTIWELLAPAICSRIRWNVGVGCVVAQGCYELGWDHYVDTGKHPGAWEYKNAWGVKKGSRGPNEFWDGKTVNETTHEYYGGNKTKITDDFRRYPSFWNAAMDQGLMFYEVDFYKRQNVLGTRDPQEYCNKIGPRYFTKEDNVYGKDVVNIYHKQNMERLDALGDQVMETLARNGGATMTPTGTQIPEGEWKPNNTLGGSSSSAAGQIYNKQIKNTNHFERKSSRQIKFIAIHDTGNTNNGADALMHYEYFEKNDRKVSSHYCVDDHSIYRYVDDKDVAHHGGSTGVRGACNQNSIGIEMCVNADGNYRTTVQKTLYLTAELMKKYNIPLENVIRHHDISGKICPASMADNNWALWGQFKKDLAYIVNAGSGPVSGGGGTGVTGGGSVSGGGTGSGLTGGTGSTSSSGGTAGGTSSTTPPTTGGTPVTANGSGTSMCQNAGIDYNALPTARKAMMDIAAAQLGKPYVFGGNGPDSFDCSGFTRWVYKYALGINLPRQSGAQAHSDLFREVPEDQARPGDLVWHSGHIMLYIKPYKPGKPIVVHAPHTGDVVKVSPASGSNNKYFQLK